MTLGFLAPQGGVIFEPYLQYTLMVLIFLGSLDLDFNIIRNELRNPKKIIFALVLIHIITPLYVLPFRVFFDPQVFIGFLIISSASVGMGNIFLSQELRGSASHALVLVAVSNIISPIIIPTTVFLYAGANANIDFFSVILTMTQLIVIPTVLARLVVYLGQREKLKQSAPYISQINIAILIYGVIAPLRDKILVEQNLSLIILAIVWALTTINYLIGYRLGNTPESKRTFGLAAAFRNYTMAIVVCKEFFNESALLPAIIFAVVGNFLIVPLQLLGKRS